MSIDTFMSIEDLMGFSGASVATSIIVSVLKKFIGNYIPSQFLSLGVALCITLMVSFLSGTANGQSYFLAVINAFLVSVASNGIYDATTKISGSTKK